MSKFKFVYVLILLFSISSCGSQEDKIPVPVLNDIKEESFGQTEVVKSNLREGANLAKKRYQEVKKLSKITVDYLNVNSGTISFNENWPTSIGIGYFNIVSVYQKDNLFTLSAVDITGTCWYIELKDINKNLETRYGASDDTSCKASSREKFKINWDKNEFPISTTNVNTLSN